MNIAEFNARFPFHTRIGTDVQPEHVKYFHDNGTEVGVWNYDRRTTCGSGEILFPDDAAMARHWYKGRSR